MLAFCFHPTWGLGLETAGGNAEPPLTLGSRELSSGTSTSPGELLLASLLGDTEAGGDEQTTGAQSQNRD